jgi:hypothetical protein
VKSHSIGRRIQMETTGQHQTPKNWRKRVKFSSRRICCFEKKSSGSLMTSSFNRKKCCKVLQFVSTWMSGSVGRCEFRRGRGVAGLAFGRHFQETIANSSWAAIFCFGSLKLFGTVQCHKNQNSKMELKELKCGNNFIEIRQNNKEKIKRQFSIFLFKNQKRRNLKKIGSKCSN